MRINSLQKIIFITFFLTAALLIEFLSKYTINGGFDCHTTFFKIEFLPMILIGFLFGWRYSLCANLLYLLIHYLWEIFIHLSVFNLTGSAHVIVFVFYFFLPYISCFFSGFFYIKDFVSLNHKKWLKMIILTFSSIIIFNIITFIIFVKFYYHQILDKLHLKELTQFFDHFNNGLSFDQSYCIYVLLSIIVNYLIIGLVIYLLIPRLKDYFVRN